MVKRQSAYTSEIFGVQGDMLTNDVTDCVRLTSILRLYEFVGKLKYAFEMMARSLYLATRQVVALHVGPSTNQTRLTEA